MKLSERGKRLVYDSEGLHRKVGPDTYAAYKCPAGVDTIYAGCTEGVKPGMVVTTAEGEALFAKEIAKFEAAVKRLVTVDINQNEFDALVSFAYNVGAQGLARSSVLRHLNRDHREAAAKSFALWNKAKVRGKMVVLPGLVRRRAAEASLFLEPIDHVEPEMPQRVAPSEDTPPAAVPATAGLAAGGIATQIPAPPDLSFVTAWQSFGDQVGGVATWALAAPWKLGIVAVAVWLIGWGLPMLARRAQQ